MRHIESSDGTLLAVEELGSGPPVVLLPGAMNDRGRLLPLAAALSALGHRGIAVDRRARGDSTDEGSGIAGAVEREVDDVRALVADLGDDVTLLGYSSGGVLALAAAAAGVPVRRLVVLEAPVVVPSAPPRDASVGPQLEALVRGGDHAGAVELYQSRVVGLPPHLASGQRDQPWFRALEAIAPSLLYDWAVTDRFPDPAAFSSVAVPALVVRARDTWPVLVESAAAIAGALPDARLEVVPGRDHEPDPGAVAAAVVAFAGA
ncbi:alpha/beta fold hydrolase [Cellulomonas sp. PhB150]|uniref:alpha/beta fold hydrolase n=1 Tax=Cellulomonas sp. PhB150 TaxID=2485188 RepID=UPI000F46D9DB|nr:alpha/beta hydrolase [Cellulomonas sp. PhB150]ROS28125.1 alpha-beta hydrolase superfamily lysophospholipase [Cellulomonas sp. PhB150]